MKKSPEAVLEVDVEGRGLLAPMTVVLDDSVANENDPRRVALRDWLSLHPNPSGPDLARAGLVAPHLPRPWGLDADVDYQLIIDDELRRENVRLPINPIGIGWAGPTILYAGTAEQQERWLPKLLSGEEFWCQLFSEPESGSDLASLTTTAVRDGDEWVISGTKVWTSYAHLATWGILLARTSKEGANQKGVSYFICPMKAKGVKISAIVDITGDHAFNEVHLDEVRLPADYLIGDVNDGWRLAKVTLGNERVSLSGEGVLWGRGPTANDLVELVRDGNVTHSELDRDDLVKAWSHGEILRLLRLRLVAAAQAGREPGAEASVRKALADDHGQEVMTLANRLAGTAGMIAGRGPGGESGVDGASWAYGFLYARALTIGGGTSEVQRNIIGERVLGLLKDLTNQLVAALLRPPTRVTFARTHVNECTECAKERPMKGFKNFLMQGELIVIAVGLVVALAFSTLIQAFSVNIITPLINSFAGGGSSGKGLGWTVNGQRINLGAFISSIVYFVTFMAVVYFIIVVPYRTYMLRRGTTVFGAPAASKTCPLCLSAGLPLAATKCKFCGNDVPAA